MVSFTKIEIDHMKVIASLSLTGLLVFRYEQNYSGFLYNKFHQHNRATLATDVFWAASLIHH